MDLEHNAMEVMTETVEDILTNIEAKSNQKVVINVCYGGFTLSPRAIERIAEIEGRQCFFFEFNIKNELIPVSLKDLESGEYPCYNWVAYDCPNIADLPQNEQWFKMSLDEQIVNRDLWKKHSHKIDYRNTERNYPPLVQAVEELGDKAAGEDSKLKVVSIPGDVIFDIYEEAGVEEIHEVHRIWS